jgi:hypothetical protein
MTNLVVPALRHLAETVLDLRERVKLALASELAQAVAAAVRDVVAATLRGDGRLTPEPARPAGPWGDDPWADEPEPVVYQPSSSGGSGLAGRLPVAVPPLLAAAVGLGRWWLRRRGTWLGALTLVVVVTAAGAVGGPAVRLGLAVAAGSAELVAVPDLLARAADRYGDI